MAVARHLRWFVAVVCDRDRGTEKLSHSLLVSNYDDRLRNHGFLMLAPGRWALSPAYDLNPVPEMDRTQMPATPISERQEPPAIAAALAAALAAAPCFGLHATAARAILREVFTAVSGWRHAGKALRIKASTLDAYATAFDNPLIAEAGKLA